MRPDQKQTDDPVEKIIREALDRAVVSYKCDEPLDFECGDFAIECKQFYTPRIIEQVKGRTDVIVIQGVKAAKAFADLIKSA